ncbi:hypothetical protein HanIR_Chr07g0312121 [Helianthus annuus]|nr:hypothetical protein HanIR_Chr07g0312121 [Helianthus annuus]
MYVCIILHNMIVEDEGYTICEWSGKEDGDLSPQNHGPTNEFTTHLERVKDLHNREACYTLRHNFIEHNFRNQFLFEISLFFLVCRHTQIHKNIWIPSSPLFLFEDNNSLPFSPSCLLSTPFCLKLHPFLFKVYSNYVKLVILYHGTMQ